MNELLRVENLRVTITSARGAVQAVRGASFSVQRGETLALVGESGCGKSMTAHAIMGLLPAQAHCTADALRLNGNDLYDKTSAGYYDHNSYQHRHSIAMVFQNPMGTFNPTLTLGYQLAEPLRLHHGFNRHDAESEVLRLLVRMKIAEPARRAGQYPHEFSGGMLQRAAIAMALAMRPQLLIADEITTALDVSTQREVLLLLDELRAEQQLGLLFITHDLGLVAQHADRVAVMYAGEVVETGPVQSVLQQPLHPYTQALLACLPARQAHGQPLYSLAGQAPDLRAPPDGCPFCARCAQAMNICARQNPPLHSSADQTQHACCWLLHKEQT